MQYFIGHVLTYSNSSLLASINLALVDSHVHCSQHCSHEEKLQNPLCFSPEVSALHHTYIGVSFTTHREDGKQDSVAIKKLNESENHKLQRFVQQLVDISIPTSVNGAFIRRWKQNSITTEVGAGPITVQTWSQLGKRQYRTRAISQGMGVCASIQDSSLFRRKLSVLITCLRVSSMPFGVDFRVRLHCPRIIHLNDTTIYAIRNGDVMSLRQNLTSGQIALGDVTQHGNSLLHVSTNLSLLSLSLPFPF